MTPYLLASTYGSGTFNGSTYNGAPGTTTNTGGTTAGGSQLTNTGFDVLMAVTLACAIIFVALLVRFWRRPKKLTE